ncbi:MAG: hypothetical protein WC796_04735 [Candidatus Pacearchaeota archaeon]|jgi:hypothetical protein
MTLVLAGKCEGRKIVCVADSVKYKGLVLFDSFPEHKVRSIGDGICLGMAGGFVDIEETYRYFAKGVSVGVRRVYKKLVEERRSNLCFAGTKPSIGGNQYLFGVVSQDSSEVLVSDESHLDSVEVGLIGYDKIPDEVLNLLRAYDPNATLGSARRSLVEILDTAKKLDKSGLPLRGLQVCVLSHEKGFEELEFIGP